MPIFERYQESLESIIKVEPEEFQTTTWKQNDRQSADNILRSKANIFLEPVVLLERHTIRTPTLIFDSDESHSEKVETLARKGNEGLGYRDPHTCCLCQKVFSNRFFLKEHLENVHLKTNKMLCNLCPKFCFTKHAIRKHIREVHSKKQFACDICEYKTAYKSSFERHNLTHAAKVECPVCKKVVTTLKRHMKAHVGEVQKCKNCDETFVSREDLRRHNLRKHYDGKLFECHCGSVYKSNQALKQHEQSHNDEKLTCEVCQKQFTTMHSLKCHWRRMHQGQSESRMRVLSRNGPFICDKCGSRFLSRQSFFVHFKSHKSATRFCDLCPRSFYLKHHLASHMESVHLKVRSFKCEICNYSSFSSGNLKIHMLRHGSKTECKICHKLVSNMYDHLKLHVKVKCPICGKMYSKKDIHRHIRTHDNKKINSKRQY